MEVPQATVLVPILFSVYINSLLSLTDARIIFYVLLFLVEIHGQQEESEKLVKCQLSLNLT